MSKVLAFIEARLVERSTQVQLATLLICGLVAVGAISMGQLTTWSTDLVTMLAIVAPIAGVLVPDPNKPISAGDAADTLMSVASTAVEAKVPGADAISADLAKVLDAAAPVLAAGSAIVSKAVSPATAVSPVPPVVAPAP